MVLEILLMIWIMEIVYVDKAGLEDLITFQGAEFEITDDYYYWQKSYY